jgi:D-lactate dehydrogenase (cytochrome)
MGLQDELTAALDSDRVTAGADERLRHGTDEGWHSAAEPDLVVYPRSTEEAAAVVRICAAHGTPIVPFGAGTSLEGHVAALQGGVSVDMTLMNAITRLSIEDMDVTVQAGVTRRQLDERLRPEGVFFSVDPGADATIGGMVATGASGDDVRALRHDARERPFSHGRDRGR